jgi:1-pyrroline-5-carboxylate dehydrogenase
MEHVTYTSGSTAAVDEDFERRLTAAREADPAPLPNLVGDSELNDGDVFERRDPANLENVASRAHAASAETVEQAVEAARAAADEWRHMPYDERCGRLLRAADAIAERQVEIAGVVSLETGKNRVEALAEVAEGIDLITTYVEVLQSNKGFLHPMRSSDPRERNTSVLKPYGVFGVIAPFNFPFALGMNMLSAALLAGNTVVFKPSEETPWSAHELARVLAAADLPEGAFNLVHGDGRVGAALVESAVDGIAFTGSAKVGREIDQKLHSGPYVRPALTELGGKNPAIVTAHADLERAVNGVARSAFGLSGQKCSACSRAIVVEDVYDDFLEQLTAFTNELRVGDPLSRDSFLGPVINEESVRRFEASVEQAGEDGRVVAGGERPRTDGHYVAPTVVADLPQGHRLTRDELFLPFVAVTGVPDLDAALAEANDTVYGLSAGIFTDDRAEQERFLDRIEAGVVYVNHESGATTGAWPGVQSFCGWKSSGGSGKGGLGPHYVAQFMREQSQTIVGS